MLFSAAVFGLCNVITVCERTDPVYTQLCMYMIELDVMIFFLSGIKPLINFKISQLFPHFKVMITLIVFPDESRGYLGFSTVTPP